MSGGNVKKTKISNAVQYTPSRYRNRIGKYKIIRSAACIGCGKCAELCPHGVHLRYPAYDRTPRPHDYKCRGFECAKRPYYCIDKCPAGALTLRLHPVYETLGDMRWTNDLILSTWDQAENGKITNDDLESNLGRSGGGFDRLRIKFPKRRTVRIDPDDVDTSLLLNRRKDDPAPRIKTGVPWYGGGMSFGSVSDKTMVAKARAGQAWNTFTCTGEGGYPDILKPFDENVITQVATGLFGVREDTIQRVRIVEFKYAQGAKPGLGGHLLGDKNTPAVARMREAVAGTALFSPFPFHSVYSIEDHKKHVDWIKAMNPNALVSAKVSTPSDVDMVAVGCYYAGVHIVHIDGSYGGTGAAPDIAKKNIAMPIEYAISKVHEFLVAEGVRDEVTLIASGGVRSARTAASSARANSSRSNAYAAATARAAAAVPAVSPPRTRIFLRLSPRNTPRSASSIFITLGAPRSSRFSRSSACPRSPNCAGAPTAFIILTIKVLTDTQCDFQGGGRNG